jgi:hypothetical protein
MRETLDAGTAQILLSNLLAGPPGGCHTRSGMDAADDPLARLAEELERLSQAHLKLGEATAQLIPQAAPEDRRILGEAAKAARAAARSAAEASAKALASTHD